ncbi:transglutaminase family protein [Gulosibacter macacae]|uniref:Transglutaminase family protein n=1 Tax=Gulosibacter macacae TaxID=2488791 RepID=A0A3P3W144_9MICO|nr:transglutaminase family protein [Gulosibacter macacae]
MSYGGEQRASVAGVHAPSGPVWKSVRVQREISSSIILNHRDGERTNFAFLVAGAAGQTYVRENLRLTIDGLEVQPLVWEQPDGTRCHRVESSGSRLELEYSATIDGFAAPVEVTETDRLVYSRPSRYAESDLLGPSTRALFKGLRNWDLVDAVVDWTHTHLAYIPGSSGFTDGARDTYLGRTGVCRDYAHLVIAFLRAMDMPARLVSVYAPGLRPMDFHAVVEVLVDDAWYVVDATHLAPRERMVRIATGRDAADTAFLTNTLAGVRLWSLQVQATTDTPVDPIDHTARVQLQ